MNNADVPTTDQSEYREIPLTRGFVAFVDAEDYDRVMKHKWSFCGHAGAKGRAIGYAYATIWKSKVLMHRFIMDILPGNPLVVGHRNGHRLDNRKSNLIVVHRHAELNNQHNLPGKPPYPEIPPPSFQATERSFLNSRVSDSSLLWRYRGFLKLRAAILSPEGSQIKLP